MAEEAQPDPTEVVLAESEEARMFKWRLGQLQRAGYTEHNARVLAFDRSVDLHRAVALLQQGCDEALAMGILL